MALQVLLVEDKDRTAEQITAILAQTPYQVTRAKDGLGGLNAAKKHTYDLVLLDHKMPLMDGLTLMRNLRDLDAYQQTPLLFMTTEDPRQIAEKATRLGATTVLAKPVERETLLSEIKRLAPRHVA